MMLPESYHPSFREGMVFQSVEVLKALPVGTIILDIVGRAIQKMDHEKWSSTAGYSGVSSRFLFSKSASFTVLGLPPRK